MRMNEPEEVGVNGLATPQTVGELLTQGPVLGIVGMSLDDAAKLMEFYGVGGLPVIDWEGRLVGVIGRTDLLHARVNDSSWRAGPRLSVDQLMSQPAVTIGSDSFIDEAAEVMERLRIHRLVVLGPDGESPIGVLAATDLVRPIAERDAS
jgi:CBS domain-containing protein